MMGLAIVLIMPFLPVFIIGWGLEQLLPESVASHVMNVLLVLTMLTFVARDVSKVLALFRKEEPIED
jgi:formate hydrogenlyase subunit 4